MEIKMFFNNQENRFNSAGELLDFLRQEEGFNISNNVGLMFCLAKMFDNNLSKDWLDSFFNDIFPMLDDDSPEDDTEAENAAEAEEASLSDEAVDTMTNDQFINLLQINPKFAVALRHQLLSQSEEPSLLQLEENFAADEEIMKQLLDGDNRDAAGFFLNNYIDENDESYEQYSELLKNQMTLAQMSENNCKLRDQVSEEQQRQGRYRETLFKLGNVLQRERNGNGLKRLNNKRLASAASLDEGDMSPPRQTRRIG